MTWINRTLHPELHAMAGQRPAWAETLRTKPAGFVEIEKLIGLDGIVSAAVVTAERGPRSGPGGVFVDDVVEFKSLAAS